ncbi:MAG: tRNA guanosine(34) transglycosylase Tgt [Candidatus Vogelbacteria bacterium CG10_big_fil_rev_8_21_14_0_10_51_16]|uniref:Queuine tRNA-ribosyltransferase n=1 Tax=Candidatus Vogelbacteria bacterium CG10_big_fil_rev_8_21_14_0_10_51_16 TaxID=1975045 RepID=A0A2H0RHM3_9BACT|nr:MAG: tRNA guanosine(34) transglycosylase Tgt [Candidatus Vogelbacteria bacterium CG10_big_fil_rev_8_21_14_0_10_51_16]
MEFSIDKKAQGALARAGILTTGHGVINTPAFVTVGTKATVKALTPEEVASLGGEVVLANTYHLYLQPGDELICKSGGLHKFMNWYGPTMTDSGGFQVFSLGVALGSGISKLSKPYATQITANVERIGADRTPPRNTLKIFTNEPASSPRQSASSPQMSVAHDGPKSLVRIDEDGVTFRSHLDGSKHLFTPERSMEIQHNIGADIIFAFDECTSPTASYDYQREAMARTHRWAERSLARHRELETSDPLPYTQALFGIVQGGRHRDLREESARFIGSLAFDGFGIGGSFDKADMGDAVSWVNRLLPEEKPRHLLGIGDPCDLFLAVENGCDLFDCVAPTRQARNGSLYTAQGRINITNARYRTDLSPIDPTCTCSVCTGGMPHPPAGGGLGWGRSYGPNPYLPSQTASPIGISKMSYTRAYLAHLFRAEELLAYRLASIHNLHFIVNLVKKMRASLLNDTFFKLKEEFLQTYGNSTTNR